MTRHPDWASDGKNWPNRAASQFVRVQNHEWHVQRMGSGPVCLLIHGTGAATHSWRDMLPLLASHYDVIAMDLPGHGFTRGMGRSPSLPYMAAALGGLVDALAVSPALVIGHSAGAAIGAQLLLDRKSAAALVGFAPALLPFPGIAARIFPGLAKMLFTNPFASILFSRIARGAGETERFLTRSTGSKSDADMLACYQALFSRSGHCDGAIRMMANWQLEPLRDRLGEIGFPVMLVHPTGDAAIPGSAVRAAAALVAGCETCEMAGLGHLAHEEDPVQAANIIHQFAQSHRIQ